jgi:hypothetical protein
MNKGKKKLQLVLVRLKGGALLTFYILFDETFLKDYQLFFKIVH